MKRISLVILLLSFSCMSLFLIGCSEKTPEKRFQFTGEIQKIVVYGPKLGTQTIDNVTEINVIKEAMQDAHVSSKAHTDEDFFTLEFIYKDDSKETVNIWYYPSAKTGRFYADKIHYSMNDSAVPALIELFKSFE